MEENTEKEKTPIYKKGGFWFILVMAIIFIAGISTTDTSNTTNTSSTSTNTSTSSYNQTNNVVEEPEPEETKVAVTIPDFSKMSKDDVEDWCNKNNIDCDIKNAYSESVKKGSFVSQSIKPSTTVYEGDEVIVTYSLGKEPTLGELNALSSAKDYLNSMAFSYKGLIKQLKYEGFSEKEATYGADNCGANWKEQASKMAKEYMNSMSFSKSGLIKQLEYEGFTSEQAKYGAKAVGY